MKWIALVGITVVVVLMVLIEWPGPKKFRKEKTALVFLSAASYVLAILLLFYPDLPSPTKMFESLYRPFTKILE
jgi:uncharacterized membrane protein